MNDRGGVKKVGSGAVGVWSGHGWCVTCVRLRLCGCLSLMCRGWCGVITWSEEPTLLCQSVIATAACW